MPHILQNKNVQLSIDLPNEGYPLSRFDWTGKITQLSYKGKNLTSTEIANAPADASCGRGFYNEFGIEYPLGHEEASLGGWFSKIGVGLLQKEAIRYQFQDKHRIRPLNFEVTTGLDSVKIHCHSPICNTYSYRLSKEIRLLNSGFIINYRLENTGQKIIITNEYNHNFLAIDHAMIGTDYLLRFPFQIQPELFGEYVDPEQLVTLGAKTIGFKDHPQVPFFFSNLSGGVSVDAKWDLINTKNKIGISETGSFKTHSINLWGWSHVICPELFHHIYLQVGKSTSWSRAYTIYEV